MPLRSHTYNAKKKEEEEDERRGGDVCCGYAAAATTTSTKKSRVAKKEEKNENAAETRGMGREKNIYAYMYACTMRYTYDACDGDGERLWHRVWASPSSSHRPKPVDSNLQLTVLFSPPPPLPSLPFESFRTA